LGEGWGMTETSPIGTFTPRDAATKPGSCGIPYPGTQMKLVDVANPEREVALGERGEIYVKGPNVMKGYWKKPEETANAMTADGFFRTGDVAIMDEDGYVYIVDRTKDMLLCGGFNVYPRNIEEAIYQHPSVEEVSVIGVPDAYRGESPKAFVKLKAGAPPLTLDELKAFLKDRLGKHEMIGALELRDELPKTPVGKISKKDLREYEARAHAS
jgi:long-chain acyl-CoA synthetase